VAKSNQKVIGLQYEPGVGLPRVVVKGSGQIAEEILKRRSLTGPKVIKNEELVNKLFKLPVDAEISKDVFYLVAILLTHVFSVEEKLKKDNE
jgi:type III secretion system FlhB-like substrate exporter